MKLPLCTVVLVLPRVSASEHARHIINARRRNMLHTARLTGNVNQLEILTSAVRTEWRERDQISVWWDRPSPRCISMPSQIWFCASGAESYFSRLRRGELGHHHHIAGPYLVRYAQEAAWREDLRRVSNGEQTHGIGVGALGGWRAR